MLRIIITGAKGRMGQAIASCAVRNKHFEIAGQIDQGDDFKAVLPKGDVVIDFSSHTATPEIAGLCATNRKPLVIGTTGHSETELSAITASKSKIPIVLASNFSTGV